MYNSMLGPTFPSDAQAASLLGSNLIVPSRATHCAGLPHETVQSCLLINHAWQSQKFTTANQIIKQLGMQGRLHCTGSIHLIHQKAEIAGKTSMVDCRMSLLGRLLLLAIEEKEQACTG